MISVEAGTGALDLGASELVHVGWEDGVGLVLEVGRAEE